MLHLAEGLAKKGHDVNLIVARYEGEYIPQLNSSIKVQALAKSGRLKGLLSVLFSFPIRRFPLRLFTLPRFLILLPACTNYLVGNRPDVVISALHNCNLAVIMARFCANCKTQIIVTEHIALSQFIRSVPKRHKKLLPFIKRLYPLADKIVTVSEGVRTDLASLTGISETHINAIYNPVITEAMLANASETPAHPWLTDPNTFKLLAVGRLTKQKDYYTLIHAISLATSEVPARLIILGEGKERRNLEELIDQLNLRDRIDLHGFVENPFSFMAHSDLFLVSSRLEGLCNVLIEAMANGCEVISTNCPFGPEEILQGGRYGTLVPVGDPKALADAIINAFRKRPRYRRAKDYARQFTVEKAVDSYLETIYQARTFK